METLRQLYASNLSRFVDFANAFPDEDLHGPLLLEPRAYFRQPRKLLIVGQETRGWLDQFTNINAQLEHYVEFNLGETQPGPFWSLTRRIEEMLGAEPFSCAWTNLNRFDHDGGPPAQAVLEKLLALDLILRDEIRILRPDVCICYTNRKYDGRLEAVFPGLIFSDIDGLPTSHFAQLSHPLLPALTIRTPHPRYMRMKKWEGAFLSTLRGRLARS